MIRRRNTFAARPRSFETKRNGPGDDMPRRNYKITDAEKYAKKYAVRPIACCVRRVRIISLYSSEIEFSNHRLEMSRAEAEICPVPSPLAF